MIRNRDFIETVLSETIQIHPQYCVCIQAYVATVLWVFRENAHSWVWIPPYAHVPMTELRQGPRVRNTAVIDDLLKLKGSHNNDRHVYGWAPFTVSVLGRTSLWGLGDAMHALSCPLCPRVCTRADELKRAKQKVL